MIAKGIIEGCEPYILVLNLLMAGITLSFMLFLAILYFTKKNMPKKQACPNTCRKGQKKKL